MGYNCLETEKYKLTNSYPFEARRRGAKYEAEERWQ
jgi:hypothetical protein